MKTLPLAGQAPFQFRRAAFLAGAVTAFLGLAVSVRATIIPQPTICISDLTAVTPTLTTPGLDSILVAGSTPTITYGYENVSIQFYTLPVFVPILGQRAVILTQGSTPTDIITFSVTQLVGQNSVNIYFADETSSDFDSLITLWSGTATSVALTGALQDLSGPLNSGENLAICVDCGTQVPDSAPTLALLGMALASVVLVHRMVRRPAGVPR